MNLTDVTCPKMKSTVQTGPTNRSVWSPLKETFCKIVKGEKQPRYKKKHAEMCFKYVSNVYIFVFRKVEDTIGNCYFI